MTLSHTVLRNVGVSLGGRIYTGVLTFVVVAILLPRVLTEEGFGIYAFYNTLFVILGVIVDFGSNAIAVREGSREPSRLASILRSLTALRFFMSLLCFGAAIALVLIFEEEHTSRLLIAAACLHILFYAPGAFGVVFHVRMKFTFAVLAAAFGHTLFFAAALALYLYGHAEPALYVVVFAAGLGVSNAAAFVMGRRMVPEPGTPRRGELARLFKEAFPLGISAVVSIAYFHVDTLLLRPVAGEEAVGLYNAAYRLLTFAILIPVLFNQVLLPVFSRFAGDENGRFRRVFRRAVVYMSATGIPVAIALAILAEPILRFIYPETYVRSAACLRILGAAVACIFLAYPHVSVLIASGRQAAYTWIALAGLAMNVILNLIWIPRFGIEGAAWATVLTEGFVLAAAAACVRIRAGFWALGPDLARTLLVAAAVGAASWLLRDAPMAAVLPGIGLLMFGSFWLCGLLPFDIGDEVRN